MAVSNVTLPSGERVNISHEDDATELDVLNFAFNEYVTNTDPGSAFGRGIRDGVDLLQTSYGSTLEGIGSLLDSESLQQVGADVIAKQRGEMDAEAFRQQRFGDQDQGLIDYTLNLAGTSTPIMGATLAGAGAGLVATGFNPLGAIAGGFLANMPFFYGDNRERQKEAIERGFRTEMDEGAAALYAVPQSLLDAAFAGIGAKFLASGALKAGGGLLTRATRGAVEGAIIEAPTELGQQFLNRYQAGLPTDSDEAKLEYVEAAKGGALLGGLFGGGTRAVFGSKEGPDAMPEPAKEETVKMPPSVTTPEGEAVSPEVEEILEVEQAPQSELTPEDEAAIDTEIDESPVNRPPPVEQDRMPTVTGQELETQPAPEPLSPDSASAEVAEAVEEMLTAEDEAAIDAELRREISGDIAPEGPVPVDLVVEDAEAQPESIVESAPVTAPPQEVDSEAVKEQQDTIDDAESRIADLQSEIDTEKSNIKEARDRNKKEIAAVRKSKLSKEDKADKIEDLKASLQDEVDDINGNIGIYKEEMSSFKKDLRKAKKELDKLNTPAQEAAPEPEGALTSEELEYILGQMDGDLTVGADAPIILFTDEEVKTSAVNPSSGNRLAKNIRDKIGLKAPKMGAVRLNLNSAFILPDGRRGILQTVHPINKSGKPNYNSSATYGSAFTIKNARINILPLNRALIALKVATKNPMASVQGEIVDVAPSTEGTVLFFNPFKNSAFVDKDGRPVIGADEITVHGSRGYARGNVQYATSTPEYATKQDVLNFLNGVPYKGKKLSISSDTKINTKNKTQEEIQGELEAIKREVMELPEPSIDTVDDSAPLTEQDVQDGKEGEQGLVVDTPVTGDVVAGADLIQPGGPVSVPNAPVISRSSLRDKNGFIYFSDRTRVGTYTGLDPESGISIPLQGGMGYAFIPQNVQAEAGWAFTSDNIFTRFRDKVNQTDGIGYVALYTKENLRANGTFLLAYIAEVEYALASGKLTRADFQSEINGLRERFLAKKVKDKDFISRDVDWYSLWNKQWKTPADLQAALDAAGFETRAAAFSAKKATTKGAKPGDLSGGQLASKRSVKKGMPDVIRMIDLFAEPDLANRKRGEIIGAVQFQKGQQSAVTASEIGSDNHLSYPLVIRGRGIGVFDSTVNVLDVIKTQKAKNQALRSAETSFPTSSEVGSAEVTAGTDTGPEIANIINEGKTFENVGQLERFISKVFTPIARKLGVDIVPNYSITRALQYNVTQGVIEYNPVGIINNTSQYLTAGMREELIHAAMHKVLINQNRGKSKVAAWTDFMTKLGQDLTQDQRQALSEVYFNLGSDMEFGAEYSRAVIQQSLYGDITEVYAKGKSFEKIKKLFRSIQGFIARTFGSEVSNPEVAGVIRASADLLKAVDPSVRPSNQVVVGAAMNNSVDLNPNSEITSQDVVEAGKPPSKRKVDLNFADKYLFTVSYVLGKIHPRLKGLIRDYYRTIQTKVLAYQTAMAPFFVKMRAIKNKADRQRLKQLLMYSPVVADAGTAEQEALLAKYGMLEDYNNLVRPSLKKLREDLEARGVDIGDLFDYFPRKIKNFKALEKVKAYWGKTVGLSFKSFIDTRNEAILKVRGEMLTLNDELVTASRNNDQAAVQRISRELKEKSDQDDVIITIGSQETALQEAQEWDKFITKFSEDNPNMLPGNARERAIKGQIPDELLQYYEDPAQAMESYIFNMVSATETIKLIGNRFVTNQQGTKLDQASELGKLVQELRASGAIIDQQADKTIPEIMKLILSPKKGESRILQLARSFGYGTLLVEFTSTLSQLYDLPFVMLDNGFFPTLSAAFSRDRLKGSAFGIDTEKISQEFAGDDKFLEKVVRMGLRSTGFTKLDQIMKETNLTANYRRFRKLANLYYKDRNNSRIKTFTAEMTALGYSRAEQDQLIADLKGDKKDSALVRSLLFNKLSETQPLSSAEMAMGIVGNPNLRLAVAMKSFMVKQMVFTKDRMLNDMFGPGRTNAQRLNASKDLAKLLTFMLLIGVPTDALKDFLAGRVGYLGDYLFDGTFRVAGVSRYTGYKIRTEGIGRAAFDYATPVAFQQAMDASGELQKVLSGERALSQSKFVAYAPYSDVINRMFGFQKERERKTLKRKAAEGESPLFIPPGAL
jgi:hypothetical protein